MSLLLLLLVAIPALLGYFLNIVAVLGYFLLCYTFLLGRCFIQGGLKGYDYHHGSLKDLSIVGFWIAFNLAPPLLWLRFVEAFADQEWYVLTGLTVVFTVVHIVLVSLIGGTLVDKIIFHTSRRGVDDMT